MKRYSKVIVLLVVLAVICAAIFVVNKTEEKKEDIESTDEIILQISEDDVTSLSWTVSRTEEEESDTDEDSSETTTESDTEESEAVFAFHRDETWLYDEDESFPVDQDKMSSILSTFSEMGAAFVIDNVEDYSQYGLDEPQCTISFTAGGMDYEVKLGGYSTMDEERYASIGDGKVYLLSTDPIDTFDVELSDMLQDDDIPNLTDTVSVKFSGSNAYSISRTDENTITYSDDDVYFTDDDISLDTSLVDSYISNISSMSLQDYVTYNATDDETAQYGLDDPELTIEVTYTESSNTDSESSDDSDTDVDSSDSSDETVNTFTLYVSRSAADKAAGDSGEDASNSDDEDTSDSDSEDSEEDAPYAYVRAGDSQIIYSITENEYDLLLACSVSDLRHQQLVWASSDDIYQIDVKLEGEEYTFWADTDSSDDADGDTEEEAADADSSDSSDTEDEESDVTWYYGDEEIDITSVRSFITGIKASVFSEDEPDGDTEIEVKVYIDNANVSEVTLTLYRHDGSTCLAEIDGEPVAYIDRDSAVNLIEAVRAIVL